MARTSETARLTKRSVDSATPWVDDHGKIRQKLYFDRDMKGFGLCVGAKSKTFFAQREVRGRQVRVTIGRYGIFTADEARTEARQLLARMAKGENPNETKRAERARSVTFRDALELYLAQPTGRGGTPRSVKTLQDYRSSAERYLKDWLDQPLADIKRRDVYDKHRKIASDISDGSGRFSGGGTYAANGAMRMFRAVYNRATRQHEDLPANPCVNIDWFPEFRREAAIPYAELHRWYTDVMEIRSPIRRDYLCFVLFTGLRKQNAAEVRWEHVDFEARTLLVPKPKSRRPFSLPLSDFLVGLLEARRTRMNSSSRSALGFSRPTADPGTSPSRRRNSPCPSRFTACATHSSRPQNRSTSRPTRSSSWSTIAYRAATSPLGTFRSRSTAYANRCNGSPTDSGN